MVTRTPEHRAKIAEALQRHWSKNPIQWKTVNRVCQECSTPFIGHTTKLFCSSNCRTISLRKRRKPRHRENKLLKKYGLTIETYESLVKLQNNLCAICKSSNKGSETKNNWCVDHDHKTDKVRGLLCHNCNLMIGYAKDNISILTSAIQYLSQNDNTTN